jgi:hypothetical protein
MHCHDFLFRVENGKTASDLEAVTVVRCGKWVPAFRLQTLPTSSRQRMLYVEGAGGVSIARNVGTKSHTAMIH